MRTILPATLSAVLFSASFPPLEIGAVAWIALVPLLVTVARARPFGAACTGALWGTLLCIVTGTPFPGMMQEYLSTPLWLGWPLLVLGGFLALGLPTALFAAWVSWLSARCLAGPMAVGAAFALAETARLATSFDIPWALVALGQTENTALMGLAPLVGAVGMGFVVATANAVFASLVEPRLAGRRPAVGRVLGALVVVAALFVGMGRETAPDAADGGHVVGVIQSGYAYPTFGEREAPLLGLDRQLALSRRAVARGAEVVVWPEYAVDFQPYEIDAPTSRRLREGAAALGADVFLGAGHLVLKPDGTAQHNSVYHLRAGNFAGRYDKEKPLWLAERDWRGIRAGIGIGSYLPGDRLQPFSTGLGWMGVALCSEVMDPWLVRRRVRDGAEILLVPANDAVFGSRVAQRQQLAAARLRAAESERWLLRPTTTGVSAVIDPRGRIAARSRSDGPEFLVERVWARSATSPYHDFGYRAWWLLVVAVGVATLRRIVS